MHELTDQELYQALAYTESSEEIAGRKIIEQFQLEQRALADPRKTAGPLVSTRFAITDTTRLGDLYVCSD